MQPDAPSPNAADAPADAAPPQPRPVRVWPGLVLVVVFWSFYHAIGLQELPISTAFMSRAGAAALLLLLFTIWWLTNRTVRLADRLTGLAVLVAGAAVACVVSLLGTFGVLFMGLPVAFTAWTLWLLVARKRSAALQRWGSIAVVTLCWTYYMLIRMDGIGGDLKPDIRWRWSPRIEDRYLAERAQTSGRTDQDDPQPAVASVTLLALGAGDWPAFRGADHDGRVAGVELAADWHTAPPELVWRRRIGPGWSSMIVIGPRLFTQEQVGPQEAVVCLDAATGLTVWSHEDANRLIDSQGGDGPRATPAFADGFIYAQGAKGILNCLDALTGRLRWTHDIVEDSGAAVPMWGFSSSPLVVEDLVIAYAGGKDGKGLLAYRTDDGQLAWTAPTGAISYSSPQLTRCGAESQVLFLSDTGLVGVEPRSGEVRWQYEAAVPGMWRAVQPLPLGDGGILIGSEDLGLVRLHVLGSEAGWSVEKRWQSKAMKPGYNDFVVQDGFVYGFDGGIFCCAELESGKRRWKQGRYGHGQVLLIADERRLLVISETGEVVTLRAEPDAHAEIARFQAIEGKTWNHPVVAHGRLYVRNDQEIACFRIGSGSTGADGKPRFEPSPTVP